MQQNSTQTTNGTMTGDGPLIDSSRVEGTKVFDPRGEDIGTIKRLVIEKVSGKVAYAVATFGAFLGMGGQDYTIPWNKLTYDQNFGGYRTDITADQLKGAPQFDSQYDRDFTNRDRQRALNDYYGAPYYWDP